MNPRRMLKGSMILVFGATLAALAYCSFRSTPNIATVPLIPVSFGRWFDHHDFIRNVVGFAGMALAGFGLAALFPQAVLSISLPGRRRLLVAEGKWLVILFAIVVLFEAGQMFLPRRTPDWRDVAAGCLAIGCVWAICCVLRRVAPLRIEA